MTDTRKSQPARPLACGRHGLDDASQDRELIEFARSVLSEFDHLTDDDMRSIVRLGGAYHTAISPELAAALLRGRKLMQEFGL